MSLIADTRLRIESNNKMSLDSVLHKFARCCLPADEEWTARELMEKYDELADTTIFTELYNQYVNSTQFPDLNATYAALGLKKQGAQLEFVTTPGFSIRREIMQKKN